MGCTIDQTRELIRRALEQLEFSYAPYSHYHVGAALLDSDGRIHTGCNVENCSYPAGICAERNAVFSAVGKGVKSFKAICIVGGRDGVVTEYAPPCGICRQVMMEFANPEEFSIILAVNEDKYSVYTLKELLPLGFGPDKL